MDLYYPNGNDWSYFRFDIYYAIDAFAHVLEFNPDNSQNIEEWMRLRGTRVLNMQLRHEDRRIYAAGEFDRYPGREQLAIWQIADAFMMQWLEANEALHGEADWLATTLPD